MKAFYCSDGFTYDIFCIGKTIETRNKNMLKNLVGERVAVIDTDLKRVYGYVTISGIKEYNDAESFYKDTEKHHISKPGKILPCRKKYCFEYSKTGKKYGYILENIERLPLLKQFEIPKNATRHGRSWIEFDL